MTSIKFNWERVADISIKDFCDIDKTKRYVLSFDTECNKREIVPIESVLEWVDWYDPTVSQSLWHDNTWVMQRS